MLLTGVLITLVLLWVAFQQGYFDKYLNPPPPKMAPVYNGSNGVAGTPSEMRAIEARRMA